MDILSIIGVVLALIAIIGGAILKGSSAGALVGSAAFVIVVLGTLAASLVQTPIEKIVEWSNIARKQGLLGLESAVEAEKDDFLKKGLQSLVDGGEPEAIRSSMEIELDTMEHFDNQAAKVFEAMGIYSPTLGIIGAVMGLMAVMQNLADPSKLGHGIAAAFIATIYGIAFANLLFLPMGNKLKAVIHGQTQVRTMVIEGIIAIAQGENPRNIESKLQGYFHH
jgi:chemotaxis protein MotA